MKKGLHINLRKLRGLIVERGYNITTFSKEIDYAFGSVSRFLNGHFKPGYDLICRIIIALDMTDEEITQIFFMRDQ